MRSNKLLRSLRQLVASVVGTGSSQCPPLLRRRTTTLMVELLEDRSVPTTFNLTPPSAALSRLRLRMEPIADLFNFRPLANATLRAANTAQTRSGMILPPIPPASATASPAFRGVGVTAHAPAAAKTPLLHRLRQLRNPADGAELVTGGPGVLHGSVSTRTLAAKTPSNGNVVLGTTSEKNGIGTATPRKVTLLAHSPRKGPKAAKVTIVEFSDFQCPFCSRVVPTLKQIHDTYPKDVAVVFVNQPLAFHAQARDAAKAFLAAGKQGKAWEMHDKMFANQQALQVAELEKYAKELGLNVDKFKKDMTDPKTEEMVAADQKLAGSVGADGTPTFFINGRELLGAQPFDSFKKIIDEEIVKADDLLKKGTKLEAVYDKLMAQTGVGSSAAKTTILQKSAKLKSPNTAKLKSPNTAKFKSPNTALWNQEYALCAGAESFNFDGVTYAKCRKKYGNSLGLTHSYPPTPTTPGGNVQTVNDIGTAPGNGSFMVSTYSPPDPQRYAVYGCKGEGSFAQCDGGICFTNTSGKNFPKIGPVADNEIICSCPIVTSKDYHVWGKAECPTTAAAYDKICEQGSKKITRADGAILHVGNTGPVTVTFALDAMYDKTFGTRSTPNICKRPSGGNNAGGGRGGDGGTCGDSAAPNPK